MSAHAGHSEAAVNERTTFGFWVYLMTDLLMFAVLFAVYAVLHDNTDGGETGRQLFKLPEMLLATIILLTSSFTSGIGMIATRKQQKNHVLLWFGITFILGLVFLGLELNEFGHLAQEGHTLQRSAFSASFFALVGFHGLHILSGLIWIAATLFFITKRGLTAPLIRKLGLLSLFWHFLDIVWIFIFTIVYLGAFA
jgi:cytochrome o ubiquinol oxidase subunit 3